MIKEDFYNIEVAGTTLSINEEIFDNKQISLEFLYKVMN